MNAEWIGKSIDVNGSMCIKKKLLQGMLAKMIPDSAIADRALEMLNEMPGDTVFFDMEFKIKTGSE